MTNLISQVFKNKEKKLVTFVTGGDPDFDAKTPGLYDLLYGNIAKYKGSISAEHGIGQLKRDQLAKVKSPAILTTMRSIKSALDPKNLMNPGKVI